MPTSQVLLQIPFSIVFNRLVSFVVLCSWVTACVAQASDQSGEVSEQDKKESEVLGQSASDLLYQIWDFAKAKELLDQALRANAYNASARADLAWYHVLYNRPELAVTEMKKAVVDDPDNPLWPAWLAWIHLWHGDLIAAEKAVNKSLQIDGRFAEGLHVQSKIFVARGHMERAIASHRRAASLDSTWQYALIQTYALAGQKEKAVNLLEKLEDSDWNSYGRVKIYLALNERAKALNWLQNAHDRKHMYFPWFGQDTDVKELRGAPEFKDLYARLGLP